MNPDTIAHVDDRAEMRAFVCAQLGLPAFRCLANYERALEGRMRAASSEPMKKRSNSGRPTKYWHNGIPIRYVLTPSQANSVRRLVREGGTLLDAMTWAEGKYGPFDWDAAIDTYKRQQEAV